MRLTKLKLHDFRAIGNLEIDFEEDVTVIVGRNGSGKTSVLDAVAMMLQPLRMLWPSANGETPLRRPAIPASDIREGKEDCRIELEFRPSTLDRSDEPWMLHAGHTNRGNESVHRLRNQANSGNYAESDPSLFVYYRQSRGFEKNSNRADSVDPEIIQDQSLSDLNAISNLNTWWDRHDADEARYVRDVDANYRDPQLEAIRYLVKQIDSFSGVMYSSSKSKPGLYFIRNDGTEVHVRNLSSGERSYIILLADLARRLYIIQPKKRLEEISGVVLIDEIELNLHPAWQSEIIPTLQRIFRSCQFIVTTHSPQVLSAVESKHVRIMKASGNGQVTVELPNSTRGRTSNYLLEGVFHANERLPEVDEKIDMFNDAIDDNDLKRAKELFEWIFSNVEGDSPDLLVLKKRLRNLENSK